MLFNDQGFEKAFIGLMLMVLKGEEKMGYKEEYMVLMAQIISGIWIHITN